MPHFTRTARLNQLKRNFFIKRKYLLISNRLSLIKVTGNQDEASWHCRFDWCIGLKE
jgi:hypothetical protein